jgi:hypothetical protein
VYPLYKSLATNRNCFTPKALSFFNISLDYFESISCAGVEIKHQKSCSILNLFFCTIDTFLAVSQLLATTLSNVTIGVTSKYFLGVILEGQQVEM